MAWRKEAMRFPAILLALIVLGGVCVAFLLPKPSSIAVGKILEDTDDLKLGDEIYIANGGFLKRVKAADLCDSIASRMKKGGFVIALYEANEEEKEKFIEVWLKALSKAGYRMAVLPVSNVSKDKRSFTFDQRILKADLVAFSAKPFGIFVVEKSDDVTADLKLVKANFKESKLSGTNIENFDYIGYIGWKRKNSDNGKEVVKVDYYIVKTNINGKTYRFFLAETHHSAIGYNGYAPKKFTTITDWKSDLWDGQVLHDWGPKNEGSNSVVTFTLTAGVQGEDPVASATISYSVQGFEVRWRDQTEPDEGLVRTVHEIPQAKDGTTYTLEPTSIGLLDPTKSGCVPMMVSHEFKVELSKWWWSESIDIDFTAALYDSSVVQIWT